MIKVENIQVTGFKAAIRGMRNPMNSWSQSDTLFIPSDWCEDDDELYKLAMVCDGKAPFIKQHDMTLMRNLAKAGHDHSKYLRMIHVSMDVTAPLYWWKEADQYKVGTVTDSCSTMHKITAKEFELSDFSTEHLTNRSLDLFDDTITKLNQYRELYLNGGEDWYSDSDSTDYYPQSKHIWWQLIQLLPSSYNQKRTWDFNYEVARNIYFARKDHKLDEWHTLCDAIAELPYFKEIFLGGDKDENN